MGKLLALLDRASHAVSVDTGAPMRIPPPEQAHPPAPTVTVHRDPKPRPVDLSLPMLPRTLAQAEEFVSDLDDDAETLAQQIEALQERMRQNRVVREAFTLAAVAMRAGLREPEQQSAD